ncbi:MAG: hypothetical protein Q7S32_00190 [bacterium]|nr:hypothetical protein [bacterium]
MFLSISAAILHGLAYAIYLHQVYGGTSVPNPASWTVWVLLSILNALTFWRGSKDALVTAQFFTGSVGCFAVWTYALSTGRFSSLDFMGWSVLVLCTLAGLVWWAKRNALYANLVIGATILFSSLPTIAGVLRNGHVEQALPWYLWTIAFLITSINVFQRRYESEKKGVCWQLLLVTPITGTVIHGIVALSAAR